MLGFDGDGDEVGFDATPLPDLELLLVAAPHHPLAQGPVDAEARTRHAELVVRDSSPRFARRPKGSFIESRNICYLSDFHSKRIALLQAAGYGWIPRHLVAEDLTAGSLVQLEDELNSWTYHPQIITREKDGFSSPVCGEEDLVVGVEVVPPSILLVLDRSGSMGGTKWNAAKTAIATVLAEKATIGLFTMVAP